MGSLIQHTEQQISMKSYLYLFISLLLLTSCQTTQPIPFHETTMAWAIELIISSLIALGGIGLAIYGYKHAFKKIARNHQHEFQIKTYQDLLTTVNECSESLSKFNAIISRFRGQIEINTSLMPLDFGLRTEQIIEAKHTVATNIVNLTGKIESVFIIEPKLGIHNIALTSMNWSLNELYKKLGDSTFLCLFQDGTDKNGKKTVIQPKKLTQDELKKHLKTIEEISDNIVDTSCYLSDLNKDIQNILLGDIYERKVSHRKPLNPNIKVISVDFYDDLKSYFENEHPLGIAENEIAESVRKQFQKM